MTYLIRQMGHVVISSPDPVGAAKDLCDVVGLRITEQEDDTVYLSSNDRHHEVTYVKGDGKAVACGLEAASADAVDEVKRRPCPMASPCSTTHRSASTTIRPFA
ncbi:hypothetical protein [Agrobacterium vitis]|uniref:hypothetical protein n=1 Tax=Agrobacterium vitis TaxID=373 RepID=UPI000A47ACCB|nr:hypothetical protein [Agrobacterium vitis]